MRQAQDEFELFVEVLSEREAIYLLVDPKDYDSIRRRDFARRERVKLLVIETNDAWIRDYGATILVSQAEQAHRFIGWRYNAWGEKYPPFDADQRVAEAMAGAYDAPFDRVDVVLEGGAIEGNGQGCLLTTESCLLGRRQLDGCHWQRQQFEQLFERVLGVQAFVWLPGGDIAGDDTDGHIDQMARFVGPERILYAQELNAADDNFATLSANRLALEAYASANAAVSLIELPMPEPVLHWGERLPASYANFVFANDAILVPQFGARQDAEAISRLGEVFPDRDIIGLSCRQLVAGLGAWHCLSQHHIAASRRG